MSEKPPKIIAIVGPTASGKSNLGLHIAQKHCGEILCADSKTVYRGLDIGSAKPTAADRESVRHHLLDLTTPDHPLTVKDFRMAAESSIHDVAGRGRLPVMVGGSGLYVDAVLYGLSLAPAPDAKLRRELNGLKLEDLIKRLRAVDPEALVQIDVRNPRRVIRAIERVGAPAPTRRPLRPQTLVLGLMMDKEVIRRRIVLRIEKMLEQGFLDEVASLGRTYGFENEAMSGIGYRAFRGVAEGTVSIAQATDEFVRGDLRLVKKQMTWFRRNPDINWLDGASPDLFVRADNIVGRFLEA